MEWLGIWGLGALTPTSTSAQVAGGLGWSGLGRGGWGWWAGLCMAC